MGRSSETATESSQLEGPREKEARVEGRRGAQAGRSDVETPTCCTRKPFGEARALARKAIGACIAKRRRATAEPLSLTTGLNQHSSEAASRRSRVVFRVDNPPGGAPRGPGSQSGPERPGRGPHSKPTPGRPESDRASDRPPVGRRPPTAQPAPATAGHHPPRRHPPRAAHTRTTTRGPPKTRPSTNTATKGFTFFWRPKCIAEPETRPAGP